MQINALSQLPALRLELNIREGAAAPLREGQLVSATVQHAPADGKLTLEIAGRLLEVRSNLRLMQGMVLLLKVEHESGQLVMRLDPQQAQQLSQDQALRQVLPRQDSLKPLLSQLHQAGIRIAAPPPNAATSTTSSTTSAAPTAAATPTAGSQALNQSLSQLLNLLPRLGQLTTASGLQQAIAQSGLFLENQLLLPQPGRYVAGDLKNILLRLASLIRQQLATQPQAQASPSSERTAILQQEQLLNLLKQSESSLARIQLNQLASLASQTRAEERVLHIELPFQLHPDREAELLRLQIRRDVPEGGKDKSPIWSVRLQLHPAAHGQIDIIVSLIGSKVATTFWCSEAATSQLFSRQLDELRARFREQGLEPGRCQARHGRPPEEPGPLPPTHKRLIDLQA